MKQSKKENKEKNLEIKTIRGMIAIYCHHHHHMSHDVLCASCTKIFEYSKNRVEKCKFKHDHLVCSECRIQCFKPDMREKVTIIMRYAGPKIIWKHPYLAIRHLKNKIISKKRKSSNVV